MENDFRIEIFECCRRAEWHRQSAETATDPRAAADFLAMQQKWLFLAGNYQFIQQLSDFIRGRDPASFRRRAAQARNAVQAEAP